MRQKYLCMNLWVKEGRGLIFATIKMQYMCSCSTSLSPVKSLKACLRKAGVPAKHFYNETPVAIPAAME